MCPCGILRAFLFGSGNVRVPALIYLSEAVCNLGLSILLGLSFGIEGVAWGTTIPVVAFEITLLVPYALKHLQVSLRRILTESIVPQAVPLLLLLAFSMHVSRHSWSHGDWRALIAVTIGGASILGVGLLLRRKLDQGILAAH